MSVRAAQGRVALLAAASVLSPESQAALSTPQGHGRRGRPALQGEFNLPGAQNLASRRCAGAENLATKSKKNHSKTIERE